MKHLDLFSGIGGFARAVDEVWPGSEHVFCDNDKFCQAILKLRYPNSKIYGDIKYLSVIDENEGKSIIETCLPKRNSNPTERILEKPLKPQGNQEKKMSAKIVEKKNGFFHIKLKGEGDIAQGSADMSRCEEITPQMLTEDFEWLEKIIQTGKMDMEEIEMIGIKKRTLSNGEEEYLREINTPVRIADLNQKRKGNLTHTILNFGKNIQVLEPSYQTEKHYVSIATKKYIGKVDILTAGVPCQPASQAGKRLGTKDDRWLWGETFRIIRETKPRFVILENVRGILTLESGLVFQSLLTEMENCGYETRIYVLPAVAVGAPHRRDRVWFVANRRPQHGQQGDIKGVETDKTKRTARSINAERQGEDDTSKPYFKQLEGGEGYDRREECGQEWSSIRGKGGTDSENDTNAERERLERQQHEECSGTEYSWNENWLEVATELCGVDDGLPAELDGYELSKAQHRVQRLKSLGNAIVPQVAVEIMKAIHGTE